MTKHLSQQEIAEIMAKPYSQDLLTGPTLARFAYNGVDGDPRVAPVGFIWNGTQLITCTVPKSAKVEALRRNPKVAITIDTDNYPPKVLLIRGTATVEIVDGVPDEYIQSGRHIPEDQFAAWEGGVRTLYKQMAVITVAPSWVKLLDFETTIPKAVEDIVREYQANAEGAES